jgi:ectoine hydroxylase-related dioxygenase (phytanoyl-CoA dioxygenase family)
MRELLSPGELRALRLETALLIKQAQRGAATADVFFKGKTPWRIEYMVDKLQSCRCLLGHPRLLRMVRALQGPSFIPTWDSMVFKLPGAARGHPWHRDASTYTSADVDKDAAAVDVGVYLDDSDERNGLWVVPASHRWRAERAAAVAERLSERPGWSPGEIAHPVPVRAGDAIFHNTLTLHGSAPYTTRLRRVVYLEFRQLQAERKFGPHTREYHFYKERTLWACIATRSLRRGRSEPVFRYRPDLVGDSGNSDNRLGTFRFAHKDFWRDDAGPAPQI